MEIEFNATIEILSENARVYMWLYLPTFGDHISAVFNEIVPHGNSTITLTITEPMIQSISWRFVDQIEAGINSGESIRIPKFCGTAKFHNAPCQVRVNITSTDNVSVTDFFPNGGSGTDPMLNLTQEGTSSTYTYLFYWALTNGPIYLDPGNYTGFACWGVHFPWPRTPIELEIEQGQSAYWTIRILAVRVDMVENPRLPSYFANIETVGGSDNLYHTWDISEALPEAVYIPPLNKSIEISGWASSEQAIIYFPHVPHAIIFVNGSNNLFYTLRYPYFQFQNTVFTPVQLALLLYLPALTFLILVRVVIMLEPSGPKRIWLNPRILPVLAMLITIVTPWFFSSETKQAYPSGYYSVFRAYFVPFFFQTTWIEGSSAIAYSQPNIVSLTLPVVFFWIPLIIAAVQIRVEKLSADKEVSAALFCIIISSLVGWFFISLDSDAFYAPGPGLILPSLISLLWIIGTWWTRMKRNDTNQSEN